MPFLQSTQATEATEARNIAALAKEFDLPLADIRTLYEEQRTRLLQGAKVKKYFPVFAMRNIRELLQLREKVV
jgi:hypothetical protein